MSEDPNSIPSQCLLNLSLNNGWKVIEKISQPQNNTGGYFSTGYKVEKEKQIAFLKAFDFHRALKSSDPLRELQNQIECFNFERDLLELCKGKHMHKVVLPIESGDVIVPGFPPLINQVFYIIFELAEGSIRTVYSIRNFDFPFIFSSLHNIAVGIQELHTHGIAHRDIKPSNALVFKDKIKISDVGRASSKDMPFKYDDWPIAGDSHYIAPEQNYINYPNSTFEPKIASDIYAFGSLFFFYLFQLPLSSIFANHFKEKGIYFSPNFEDDLDVWIKTFDDILIETESILLTKMKKENVSLIIQMIHQLCYPDPKQRGHIKNVTKGIQQYSLERFIPQLDILSKKAKYNVL